MLTTMARDTQQIATELRWRPRRLISGLSVIGNYTCFATVACSPPVCLHPMQYAHEIVTSVRGSGRHTIRSRTDSLDLESIMYWRCKYTRLLCTADACPVFSLYLASKHHDNVPCNARPLRFCRTVIVATIAHSPPSPASVLYGSFYELARLSKGMSRLQTQTEVLMSCGYQPSSCSHPPAARDKDRDGQAELSLKKSAGRPYTDCSTRRFIFHPSSDPIVLRDRKIVRARKR
jgi:hypothetical protein